MNATKFFATADRSVAAPGAVSTVTIEFNGVPPTSGTITAVTSATGTFSPTSIALDGAATKSFTYTPAAGSGVEHDLSFSNSAGLYNSAPVPLNVFAASSGVAQAIGAPTLRLGDQAVHYRDNPSVMPTGFGTANTRGFGEVWVTFPQAMPAVFARLYDRRSTGATTTVGTGTELTSGWVQVYGAVSAGQTVRLLLPAIRAKQVWMDVSASSTGANAARVANCFSVGTIILFSSRSQLAGWGRGYAMGNNDNAGNHVNKIVNWNMTCELLSGDARYANEGGGWWRVNGETLDGTNIDGNIAGEPTSNGSMEAGRLMDLQTGTMLGIVGCDYIGGGFDEYVDLTTGKPTGSTLYTAAAATRDPGNAEHVLPKAHYYMLVGGNFDNVPESVDNYNKVFTLPAAWVMTNMPTVHVVGLASGQAGFFGMDGSRALGYTRLHAMIRAQEAALPHIATIEDYHWNLFVGGHSSGGSRPPMVREGMRHLLSAERQSWGGLQTTRLGPTLASTATRSGSVIRFPYELNGATALSAIKFSYPDVGTFSVATTTNPSDPVILFAVYPQGGNAGNGSTALPISGVVINTASPPSGYDGTIDVTLSGSGPFAANLTAHYAADFTASGGSYAMNSGTMIVLVDNVDPFGVGYGQAMRPALDIAVSGS